MADDNSEKIEKYSFLYEKKSQAVFAKGGNMAGTPARPAKRAKRVMPIMGESSTTL